MYWFVIILILVSIITITYLLYTQKSQEEGFVERTTQTSRITSIMDIIADPEDAEAVADTFYERLNDRNMEIRKKTIKYYSPDDINPNDRDLIRNAFQYARTVYPLPIIGQMQIVVTSDKTEGGYPHTHGNMIYIPIGTIKNSSENNLQNTLIHEMSHIHQRQKKFLWEKLYSNIGFQRLPINWAEPEDIRDKILTNPDTWEGGKWEYKGQHGVILINDDAKSVKDHSYQVIPVRDGVNMKENQFKKVFGKITKQIDHPAEITATGLQKYIENGNAGSIELTDAIRCWLDDCRAD
jgi:hypothetical protein